jgi:hypothetical protein
MKGILRHYKSTIFFILQDTVLEILKIFLAGFLVRVGGLVGVPQPFCDILKGPSHRSFILEMGLLSAILPEIYMFLA